MNIYDALILKALGGGGGTTVVANPEGEATDELEKLQVGSDIYGIPKDYAELDNKPQINSVTLSGNKTASELGLQVELDGAQTVSGNPITVADAQPMNAESVVVELEPKQDLHGYDAPWVGGAGKNKFDVSQYDSGYFTRNNETLTNTLTDTKSQFNLALWTDISNVQTTNLINEDISENGTYSYTFTVDEPSVDSLVLKHNGSNRDLIISDFPWTTQGTFTLSLTVEGHDPSTVGGLVVSNIQIEQGNQATTFAPYSNICPITGYSEVNVERVGKNRFNPLVNVNKWLESDGTFLNDEGSLTSQKIKVKNGQTFTLSTTSPSTALAIGFYDINDNLLQRVAQAYVKNITATAPNNTVYMYASRYRPSSTPQLELGNQPTSYEPYQGNTYTIDLDGTKYGGTLDVTNGDADSRFGFIEFDGSEDENWQKEPSDWNVNHLNVFYIQLPVAGKNVGDSATPNIISNPIEVISFNGIQSADKYGYMTQSGYGQYIDVALDFDTVADLKTWLANNPLQVCYELATPLTIHLTPTQIQMLENTNNISTDGTNITLKYQPNNVIGECKAYTDEQCSEVLPPLPTTDGTYHLSCEVTSGVGVLSWVSDS